MPLWLINPSTSWPAANPVPIDTVAPVILAVSTSLSVRPGAIAAAGPFSEYASVPALASTGASLTALTSNVMVLALWSRSCPALAVPPLSLSWNVNVL